MKLITHVKTKVDKVKGFVQPLMDKHLDEVKEIVEISSNSAIFIKEKLDEIEKSVERIMISITNINYNINKRKRSNF